jgi:hypothetical protein
MRIEGLALAHLSMFGILICPFMIGCGSGSGSSTTPPPVTTTLPAPTFDPAAGAYSSSQSVTISDATAGTTIYYTTDGSTPTTSSSVYSGAITVSATETLSALATESGDNNSSVAQAVYILTEECTSPVWSSSTATGNGSEDGFDVSGIWWVGNDAWYSAHGPQTIYACNQGSWYAVSTQTGTAVETYPNTEYDIGGRNSLSTEPISQYNSITATFAEEFATTSGNNWDAAYDLWLNDWGKEIMIWNEWAGGQAYWPGQSIQALTLDGVPYHFYKNGSELMFFRDTQVKSGSVDILAAMNWLVGQGLLNSTDVPTQLQYGVEICATPGDSSEKFSVTNVTFSVQ